MFTEKFGRYACDGDSISCEIDGFTLTATIVADNDAGAPWKNEDGHGPVSEWTTSGKNAGERVLASERDSKRYYDFAEAVRMAKRDGWGVSGGKKEGETNAQYAARAAEADFESLRAWCNDEWHYVGVCVTVSRDDIQLTGDYDFALWGVDCNHPQGNNDYLTEVANEYVDEALAAARARIAKLCAA